MATTSDWCNHTIHRFTADVSNLASTAVESSVIKLSNVNWKVRLSQTASNKKNNKRVLAVHLVSEFDDKAVTSVIGDSMPLSIITMFFKSSSNGTHVAC